MSFPLFSTIDSTLLMYFTDRDDNRIRRISPTGYLSTLAGGGVERTSMPLVLMPVSIHTMESLLTLAVLFMCQIVTI